MSKCKCKWELQVSHGVWYGYGIDAEQFTDLWYECMKCGASKDWVEGEEV
tara:strand:- start:9282 stop:9431 length:150 start_codon:yes stop_codon:yes gene_type:complete